MEKKDPPKPTDWSTEVASFFSLPIDACGSRCRTLKPEIVRDLELVEAADTVPLYHRVANTLPNNQLAKAMMHVLSQRYTDDRRFLRDTQTWLQRPSHPAEPLDETNRVELCSKVMDTWSTIRTEHGFKEKYLYVEWDRLAALNQNSTFLQCFSAYNLLSPLITLLLPIIILLVPFVILQLRGLAVTFAQYMDVLKMVAATNAVGKLFVTDFAAIGTKDRLYIVTSAIFYLFSVYQNFNVALRYYTNLSSIASHFGVLRSFADLTVARIDRLEQAAAGLTSYAPFVATQGVQREQWRALRLRLHALCAHATAVGWLGSMGSTLQLWWELHTSAEYHALVMSGLALHGYLDVVEGVRRRVASGELAMATFLLEKTKKEEKVKAKKNQKKEKKEKKAVMQGAFFPALLDQQPKGNTLQLDKHLILTGPNASGKTTVLKTVLANVLLAQQWGCGCFRKARLPLFQQLHCYLNIPDTSGRDSLFQAEARRCKQILDAVQSASAERHLCVFDELYSGTNPEEANASSTAFMRYLAKFDTVQSVLTTHFADVCRELQQDPRMANFQMRTSRDPATGAVHFHYQVIPGISTVQGGVDILRKMAYPEELLADSFKGMEKMCDEKRK